MINQITSGKIQSDKIKINERELALRLKTEVGFENEMIKECKEELLKAVECKYAYTEVPVNLSENNYVNLYFCQTKSKDLYKNLKGCKSACVFAITLGIGVDRLLSKLNVVSQSKYFITDAIASALAESLCDYVNQMIGENKKTKRRFSAGYGDLSLEIQKDILNVLLADKTLGITLNESLLMTPVKSITAIMGVIEN